MRAVVQRVLKCSVRVKESTVGKIESGLLVYLGVEKGDEYQDITYLVNKISGLRIFEDSEGKMNLSLSDVGGEILVVSQFTLLADTRKGRRPSYNKAAEPDKAFNMYNSFVKLFTEAGFKVKTGQFQALMDIEYINNGPVTILIDSRKTF